jgi:hypothetical protein
LQAKNPYFDKKVSRETLTYHEAAGNQAGRQHKKWHNRLNEGKQMWIYEELTHDEDSKSMNETLLRDK